METIALNIKFWLFLALQLSVLVPVGAILIAGLYQIMRDAVREASRSPGET